MRIKEKWLQCRSESGRDIGRKALFCVSDEALAETTKGEGRGQRDGCHCEKRMTDWQFAQCVERMPLMLRRKQPGFLKRPRCCASDEASAETAMMKGGGSEMAAVAEKTDGWLEICATRKNGIGFVVAQARLDMDELRSILRFSGVNAE